MQNKTTFLQDPSHISKLEEMSSDSLQEMERLALLIKDLILSQPPQELLGFLWGQVLILNINNQKPSSKQNVKNLYAKDLSIITTAMEYIHAILSSFEKNKKQQERLQEEAAKNIIEASEMILQNSFAHCIGSSKPGKESIFGDITCEVDFLAKTNWVNIRGNRYQVLEEEFFLYILSPHNEALLQTYGIGANEVAKGIQDISNTMRLGFANAFETMTRYQSETAHNDDKKHISFHEAIKELKNNPNDVETIKQCIMDIFFGGLCNISKHTNLPTELLTDLSYNRGENN